MADISRKGCCYAEQQRRHSHCSVVGQPQPAARSWHLHRAEQYRFADAPLLLRNELTAVNGIDCDPKDLDCAAPPPKLRLQSTALLPTHPTSGNLGDEGTRCMPVVGDTNDLDRSPRTGTAARTPSVRTDCPHPQKQPKRQPTFSVMPPSPWSSCPLLALQNRTMNPCLCAASERCDPDITANRANPMALMVPLSRPNRALAASTNRGIHGKPSLTPLA